MPQTQAIYYRGHRGVEPVAMTMTIPVLKRILAVLDEELLIGIDRRVPDEDPEREVAPAPEPAAV